MRVEKEAGHHYLIMIFEPEYLYSTRILDENLACVISGVLEAMESNENSPTEKRENKFKEWGYKSYKYKYNKLRPRQYSEARGF